jgi:hypothetical protein
VVPSSSRAAIETLRRRQNLASTSGKLGAGHIEFAADKLVMRDRRTLPSRQRTYRYLHVRVDRLEHAISHFYNAIKARIATASFKELKSKRLTHHAIPLPQSNYGTRGATHWR